MSNTELQTPADRERIHAIVSVLKGQYEDRLRSTTKQYDTAQHELNRASHEITRLERHLSRIDAFCEKNNVRLETA